MSGYGAIGSVEVTFCGPRWWVKLRKSDWPSDVSWLPVEVGSLCW